MNRAKTVDADNAAVSSDAPARISPVYQISVSSGFNRSGNPASSNATIRNATGNGFGYMDQDAIQEISAVTLGARGDYPYLLVIRNDELGCLVDLAVE